MHHIRRVDAASTIVECTRILALLMRSSLYCIRLGDKKRDGTTLYTGRISNEGADLTNHSNWQFDGTWKGRRLCRWKLATVGYLIQRNPATRIWEDAVISCIFSNLQYNIKLE
jgi:hypothetical protein